MTDFLTTSTICLLVFLGFYHLILEKEKMHKFNRFYLLFSLVISLTIPFLNFEIIKIIPVIENVEIPQTVSIPTSIPNTETVIELQETIDYKPYIVWSLYGLITLVLFFRFIKNCLKLILKSKSNPTVKFQNANLVLVEEKIIPHTFWNSIYINSDDYKNRNIENELFTHELVHVTQKHSIDVLFIETLKTIFWFNPLFYFYKKAIQLNHEFLADEEVVKSCDNIRFYQNLLLQKNNINHVFLTSNLNYQITKKRLIMMTKNTSKTLATLKKAAIIPILCGMIYFFCIEIVAQEKVVNTIENKPEKTPNEEDKIRDAYYSNVRIILKDLRTNTSIDKMYEELTLEEKRKYLSHVPDMLIAKEIPEPLFEKMKTKNMAVWINGKASSKEEIQKYKRTDFSHYTYSFVHKNARSKRFPQEYQYTLYTKKYFDENLKNSHLHYKNDTLRMTISNKKDEFNKVSNILNPNKTKADTIVWFSNDKEEYNLYIKDTVKKKPVEINKEENNKNIETYKKNKVNNLKDYDTGNLKTGYIYLNNKGTVYFVKNDANEIEYYNRWGIRVDENGEKSEVNSNSTPELTQQPEFEGGMSAFFKYIAVNYKIPEEITKRKISGKIYMSFMIEHDGTLSNIKTLKDLGYGTGDEAIRVLKESPKWKPGKIGEKPVRAEYSLPISISN